MVKNCNVSIIIFSMTTLVHFIVLLHANTMYIRQLVREYIITVSFVKVNANVQSTQLIVNTTYQSVLVM